MTKEDGTIVIPLQLSAVAVRDIGTHYVESLDYMNRRSLMLLLAEGLFALVPSGEDNQELCRSIVGQIQSLPEPASPVPRLTAKLYAVKTQAKDVFSNSNEKSLESVIVVTNDLRFIVPSAELQVPYYLPCKDSELARVKELVCEVWRATTEENFAYPTVGVRRALITTVESDFAIVGCSAKQAEAAHSIGLNPIRLIAGMGLSLWGAFLWQNGDLMPTHFKATVQELRSRRVNFALTEEPK